MLLGHRLIFLVNLLLCTIEPLIKNLNKKERERERERERFQLTFWIWALLAQNIHGPIKGLLRVSSLKGLIDVLLILAGECYTLKLL